MLAVELATYLDDQGLVTFSATAAGGDCFVEKLPQSPDEAVAIMSTGGWREDGKLGYDSPTLQLVVRGTKDPQAGFERAVALYDALHGLHAVELVDGGTYVVGCWAQQSAPIRLGPDDNGRYEYSINLLLHVRSLTMHRE